MVTYFLGLAFSLGLTACRPTPLCRLPTPQTGVIPDSLVRLMGTPTRFVSLRFNYLSCCGKVFNAANNT